VNTKEQNKRKRSGMTLVEVVVFLSLTFIVAGSVIAVAMQASWTDKAVEEKTAAFYYCKSRLEELHPVKFEDLVSPKTGTWTTNMVGGVQQFKRVRTNVHFYTRGDPSHKKLLGKEELIMVYGSTGKTTNCTATAMLTWNTSRATKTVTLTNKVSTIFYP